MKHHHIRKCNLSSCKPFVTSATSLIFSSIFKPPFLQNKKAEPTGIEPVKLGLAVPKKLGGAMPF